ncbi:MAG TPA: hypothetical protein VFR21_17650 [Bradyrhizobium sp.]|jgi:hypothetical protein|nr:hypothetical protein [Bradyrhizobium sp.]
MGKAAKWFFLTLLCAAAAGCGLAVPQIAEPWDRVLDPDATKSMERQIKLAIFCELRYAVLDVRNDPNNYPDFVSYGKRQNTNVDVPLPDYWGAQVALTFTVDESTKFSPGVSLNTPMHDASVHFKGEVIGAADPLTAAFTFANKVVPQSYAFGLGGVVSSEANRVDQYNSYYTMNELGKPIPPSFICDRENDETLVGPPSHSSPFLIKSSLGVGDWLRQAWPVNNFIRSSRADDKVGGLPIKTFEGGAADVMSYHIKFEIVSSINATPTWNLVRVSTTSNPLLDVGRTRTHELLITIGPGGVIPNVVAARRLGIATGGGPSTDAFAVHNAQLIGSAVANALRTAR